VNVWEVFFGVIIILVLLGVAGFFGWQQIQNLQLLRNKRDLPPDERIFLRRQIRRRLVCSVLMFLFAGLLAGWLVIDSNLPDLRPANPDEKPGENPWIVMTALYITCILFVLFAILALAGIDLIATARFGFRSQRLLEIERRAVLEAEAARLRKKHHEQNGA
jgi:heme A synthase